MKKLPKQNHHKYKYNQNPNNILCQMKVFKISFLTFTKNPKREVMEWRITYWVWSKLSSES